MTKKIATDAYRLSVGGAGAFLLDDDGKITLIDAGLAGNVDEIWGGLKTLGRGPGDLKNVLITHYHQDHLGCLPQVLERAAPRVFAPSGDAELIRSGGSAPQMQTRGVLGALLSRFIKIRDMPPNRVDEEVSDGDELPIAGGIRVVATPGHTGGHVAYLWPRHGGVLFAGDSAMAFLGRVQPLPVGENFEAAERSLVALAALKFQAAGFGHGAPIKSRASARFRSAARRYS